MASITTNSIPSVSGDGILQTDNALTTSLQIVKDNVGNDSAMSLSQNELSLRRNTLMNFTPIYQTGGTLIIDATNHDQLNCSVYGLAGATTVTFTNLFDGFSMSFIQLDATDTQFVAGGGYTLANRQGHTPFSRTIRYDFYLFS
jgi:hypothetical protein